MKLIGPIRLYGLICNQLQYTVKGKGKIMKSGHIMYGLHEETCAYACTLYLWKET